MDFCVLFSVLASGKKDVFSATFVCPCEREPLRRQRWSSANASGDVYEVAKPVRGACLMQAQHFAIYLTQVAPPP